VREAGAKDAWRLTRLVGEMGGQDDGADGGDLMALRSLQTLRATEQEHGRAVPPAVSYDAFVSYSHAVDGRLAPALQGALQRFSKPWYRLRALRVFRDNASLAANPGLWSSIEQALERSRWFVLLASPGAARSPWVAREIDTWLRRHGTERLLIAVTDGGLVWDDNAGAFAAGPNAALPAALLTAFEEEPRFIDLRFARTADHLSLSDARFRDVIADLAAPIHGRPKDELVGEEVRQHRRAVRLARAAAASLVILLLAAVLGAVFAVGQRNEARDQRNEAIAQERSSRSRELAANSLLNLPSDPELSLLLSIEAAETQATPEAENALRQALLQSHARAVLAGHDDAVLDVGVSPDGRRVITGSSDRTARLWDAQTGRVAAVLRGHRNAVDGAVFSDDGRLALTWAQDGTARVWDASSGRLVRVLRDETDPQGRLTDATFNADASLVATSNFLGDRVNIWDVTTGRRRSVLRVVPESIVDDVDFSPSGEELAGVTQDGHTHVWSTNGGRSIAALPGHTTYAWAVDYSSDGRHVIDASEDGTAIVWDVEAREPVALLGRTGDPPLTSALFSPDGSPVLTTSQDGTARLWDVATSSMVFELSGHEDTINDAAFTSAGDFLVTASEDGTARVWEASTGRTIAELRGHRGAVTSASFSSDGRLVATSAADGTARIWDPWSGEPIRTFPPPGRREALIQTVDFSSDGRRVLAVDSEGRGTVWAGSTGRRLADLGIRPGELVIGRGGAFSPDGSRFATYQDRNISVWDVGAGKPISRVRHTDGVQDVVFGPDGQLAASADWSGNVRIWEVGTGRGLAVLDHQRNLNAFRFSPDGRLLATASQDGVVRLWDSETGRRRASLAAHAGESAEGFVFFADTVDFTPDGKLLATSGDDGTVRIWDVATRKERTVISAHPPVPPRHSNGLRATLSPDGDLVVSTAAWEPVARVWRVSDGKLVAELAGHAAGLSGADFSTDGRFVVTTSWDGTARVWEASTGRAVIVIRPPTPRGPLQDLSPAAAFSPDGKSVLVGAEQNLRLYRCDVCGSLDELLGVARAQTTRKLTPGERARYLHEQ
jgi:WD40 repeat protein